MRSVCKVFVLVALAIGGAIAHAQQTPIARYTRLTGNINFVVTGGSLRTQDNDGNACAVGATDTAALAGIPTGAAVLGAYLYWGGSGSAIDGAVTLNGAAVAASRTFAATYTTGGEDYPFFGAFADVTVRVAGNGSFTFGGLGVTTGAPHCAVQAVAAGWSLVVIYGSADERLRAINVFDGLQYFRGSALTLNPDGFRIPPADYDGRIAIVALEGDPQNSTPMNGFSESLRFNGTVLDDGINVAGSDPLVQPYDGTVNSPGIATSYGFDVDIFDVTAQFAPGQTGATTEFSSGGDLVLLLAQIVSATSEPTVDLSIAKSHAGDFLVGSGGSYVLRVANAAGQQREDNAITVTDTLPAGLTYVSATGTGWTCAAVGQDVSCTHPPVIDPGQALPDITLTVSVGMAAYPAVSNTARVTSASFESAPGNNEATDVATVRASDLSTSTLAVQDLNGGEVAPGDVLRYTLALIETGGVAAGSVTSAAPLPTNTQALGVVSMPAGAVDGSTPLQLAVSAIAVPASGAATIVFDVQVPAAATPGTPIDAAAAITNPAGAGATPAAPQLIVLPSAIPSSGVKALYLRGTGAGLARTLSRVRAVSGEALVPVSPGAANAVTWTLGPALQLPLTLPAGNIPVPLWLSRTGSGTSRALQLTLANSATGTIGTTTVTVTGVPNNTTGAGYPASFVLPNTTPRTYPAGSAFTLRIQQTSPTGGSTATRVHPYAGGQSYSRVLLASSTVINVDSVTSYDAAYPGGSATATFHRGDTVHVRAVVSDPFGSFDITRARLELVDAGGGAQVANATMTEVAAAAATKTYQYTYTLPAAAATGGWAMRVTADEGAEGTVTDLGVGGFVVVLPLPSLMVTKVSEVLSDPINAGSSPKRIPGAVVRYAISVSNSGPGVVDASSLVIATPVPQGAELYVAAGGGGPVEYIEGTPASGLTFNGATDVTYSNQPGGGAPYTYAPVPDGQGFDPAVTGLRIAPGGAMNAAGGAGQPSFTVRLRVRIQ